MLAPLTKSCRPGELHRAIRLRQILLVEVQHDQQRLRREELEPAQPARIVRRQLQVAQRLALLEQRAAALQDLLFLLQLRRGAGFLQISLEPFEPPLDDAEVREDDFVFHRPHVARGIDGAGRVRHGRIAKHAHDVEQRVRVAERRDVEQGGGAGLPGRGAPHVGEFDGRRRVFLRVEERGQLVEARSGTRETPTLASCFPAGRGASRALVRSWKRAVLPDEGNPMRPARSIVRSAHASTPNGAKIKRKPKRLYILPLTGHRPDPYYRGGLFWSKVE